MLTLNLTLEMTLNFKVKISFLNGNLNQAGKQLMILKFNFEVIS